MENIEKKKIEVQLIRKDGKTFFQFRIDKKIENNYILKNPEIRDSQNWEGLKFYYLPELTNNIGYNEKLKVYHLFDDYGSKLYDEKIKYLNIAWMRTVGGFGNIEIKEHISFAELSSLIKNSLQFIKEYFDEYYKEFKIKGSVTVEL